MAVRRRLTGKTSTRKPARRIRTSQRKGYTHAFIDLLTKAQDSQQLRDPSLSRTSQIGERAIISPIFAFGRLCQLPLESNILRQCIEAYVTNIEAYGHLLEYVGPTGSEDSKEAQTEKRKLNSVLKMPAPGRNLRDIREASRWDKETLGNRFFEISRNQLNEIVLFDQIPGSTMRMTKRDKDHTDVEVEFPDPEKDGTIMRTVSRHFRRFVQLGQSGKKIFFKEFGDPRAIDPKTGKVDPTLTIEDQATEVFHDFIYSPGSVYGLPRWIGQIPSVLGSRESELVNLNFFRENAIPAMSVLISGGALTEDSFERIEDYINAARGRDAMQRVMVLEASADETQGSIDHSQPAPKIDMKPMLSQRQQDGLFQVYDQNNMQKIRSSFRLPPIFVGRAEDYTRSSAHASILVAENQIFIPERLSFDDIMNDHILSTYKPKFWRFKTMGPSINDPESLTRMIDSFSKQGAVSPNTVIKLANKVLDSEISPIMEEWGDAPFAIVMDAVKRGIPIPGLDAFIAKIDEPDENNASPATDGEKRLKKVLRSELAMITSDLQEAIAESLQTYARSVA